MLDKKLLAYLKGKRHYLVLIVITNIIGLFLNLFTTGSLIIAIKIFIDTHYINGIYALLVTLGLAGLKVLTTWLSSYLSNQLADYVSKRLRYETYSKYLELNGKTPFTTSEMAQLSTEGIEQLRLYYSTYIPSFFYAMIAPIILFIIFCFLDWSVALIYLACVPLIPISIISVSKFAKKIFAKYWDKYISLGNGFLDNSQGMKELKIFKYDAQKQIEMDNESEEFRKVTMKVLTMQLASVTIMDLVAFGGAGIGIVLTLYSLIYAHRIAAIGVLDPVYVAVFMILVGAEFFLPLRALGSAFHVAMNGATAGRKIMTLLNIPSPVPGVIMLDNIKNVTMDHILFKYEDGENNVLEDVSFQFKKGLYSLVGLSGSGKSTIAKLFSQTILPTAGEIKINGTNITEYDEHSFFDKVAYISNNTYIFHQSIRDSFKLYNPQISEEEMKALLSKVKLSHLDLDYVILEDSSNLSGGEKQRLSLALYLSKSYQFYIFDEITSNIDIESEEIILDIIKDLAKDNVVLMISHRLKSTSIAKHIYYLEDGKIVCDGTYNALLKGENAFKDLYQTQQRLEEVL